MLKNKLVTLYINTTLLKHTILVLISLAYLIDYLDFIDNVVLKLVIN